MPSALGVPVFPYRAAFNFFLSSPNAFFCPLDGDVEAKTATLVFSWAGESRNFENAAIVAHEATHAMLHLCQTGFGTRGESGALNEALADFMSCVWRAEHNCDEPWIVSVGSVFSRDMTIMPKRCGRVDDPRDDGYTHTNCKVIAHAFWLLVQEHGLLQTARLLWSVATGHDATGHDKQTFRGFWQGVLAGMDDSAASGPSVRRASGLIEALARRTVDPPSAAAAPASAAAPAGAAAAAAAAKKEEEKSGAAAAALPEADPIHLLLRTVDDEDRK
jgi:hypothetical protein